LQLADAETFVAHAGRWVRSPIETARQLVAIAERVEDELPAKAAWALARCAGTAFLVGDLAAGITQGRKAKLLAEQGSDQLAMAVAERSLRWNLLLAGLATEDREASGTEGPINLAPKNPTPEQIAMGQTTSLMMLIEEQWDDGELLVDHVLNVARRLGLRGSVELLSIILGQFRWRRGRWHEGYLLTTQDLHLDDHANISFAWGHALAAQISASMGNAEQTHDHLQHAFLGANRLGIPMVHALCYSARGHLHLSSGEFEQALPSFDKVADICAQMGMREPGYILWHGDRLSTLIALGRRSEAIAALEELREIAEATGRTWAKGIVARADAELASSAIRAEASFDEALKWFTSLGMPFEIARTLLARGTSKRRRGDVRAVEDLDEAKRIFLRLGAQRWAAQVASVDGVPGAVSVTQKAVTDLLSPAELRVAMSVVSGRTNKQTASELYVSVKTVEYHLQAMYKRLNVKNRAEFVATFVQNSRSTSP
jgi:DNA-binding CsgD family transcriptional regulator